MQQIIHSNNYKSIHPIFDELDMFYMLTSEKSLLEQSALIQPIFDDAFEFLQGLFIEYGKVDYNFNFKDKNYSKLRLPKYDEKNIIVLFSGGKDSTATALKYKNMGYNVYLFHVKQINKAYPNEWESAEQVAKYLDLPLYIGLFMSKGKLDFAEHPMKNMILASMALHWGIENNITDKIVVGNYRMGELNSSSFYINGDDMPLMWMAYRSILNKYVPSADVLLGLENAGETMDILSTDSTIINLTQSCLGAHRFRQYNHNNNEKKYGIKLLDNRCGSCWKCCAEYIYMADHELMEYNEQYYKHCLDVIKKADKEENGVEFSDIEYLWYGYFFYDINKSKYSNILNYK